MNTPRKAGNIVIVFCVMLCICFFCACDQGGRKRYASITDIPVKDFENPKIATDLFNSELMDIPALIEKMKAATGDIDYLPRKKESVSSRFYIQFIIVNVLRREYLKRHPRYRIVSFPSKDNSLQILRWWEKEKHNVIGGDLLSLPDTMIPCVSEAELKAKAKELEATFIRAREENAEFKRRGYKTINEMLAATGKAEEVDSQE